MSRRRLPIEPKGRWFCGHCAGHLEINCTECWDGCDECGGTGRISCPTCKGGKVPVPPPDFLPL